MRTLSTVLVCIFMITGCSVHNKVEMTSVQIEYSALSRGFSQKIKIQNQMVVSSGEENPVERKMTDSEWNEISKEFQKLDLENITNLKAPTNKRVYDGAAIGVLTIRQNDKIYQTEDFDNGFPPKEIEKLVNLVVKSAK